MIYTVGVFKELYRIENFVGLWGSGQDGCTGENEIIECKEMNMNMYLLVLCMNNFE